MIAGKAAYSQTIDQLKGLSISIKSQSILEGRYVMRNGQPVSPYDPLWTTVLNTSNDIYISLAGRIFQYSNNNSSSSNFTRTAKRIYSLDKAENARCGGLQVWTISDGNLTHIWKMIKGFQKFSITVDAASMSCSANNVWTPDEPGGDMIQTTQETADTTCDKFKEISYRQLNSQCLVTRGNIFADDK